ncbi:MULTISPECIES: hypothetical protein [Caballeronia]|uniref:hypothetical protein n=1 Tax=Caballeronia TaxID=1827195 RepID=UPI00025BCC71|nr:MULTISPECIES: hypothetical protein [Caballeronia]MDR5748163.1 hypothetical protein [Caballeronia sp. LZ029]
MVVIPYVQPGIVKKNNAVNAAGLDNLAHSLTVHERARPLVRENDLHKRAEVLGDFTETRAPRRISYAQPEQQCCPWTCRITNHEAQDLVPGKY